MNLQAAQRKGYIILKISGIAPSLPTKTIPDGKDFMSQIDVPLPRKAITVFAFVACLFGSRLYAQLESGAILGTVTDQSNAIIRGAKVTLTNEDTGLALSTSTSERGTYVFTPITIGRYSVSAEFPGFSTISRQQIQVSVQQQVVVDFLLNPGQAKQTVEVTAGVPLLQAENASVGQVINGKQINDLPLNGRNFAPSACSLIPMRSRSSR
jgi:hypothetical protein